MMLGWWFVIYPEGADQKEATLASWETGIDGLNWIKPLVCAGKAVQTRNDGYPNWYIVKAAEVLPLLADLGGAEPRTKKYNLNLRSDNIAACAPDTTLVIHAWDRS